MIDGTNGTAYCKLGVKLGKCKKLSLVAKDVAERKGKVIARNLQTVSCEFVRTHFFWKQST